MTTQGATGIESTGTTDSEPCDQLLERVEALEARIDEQDDRIAELENENEELREEVEQKSNAIEYVHDRIDTLKHENREQHKSVFAQPQRFEDSPLSADDSETADEPSLTKDKTPLHQITNFTEDMAERELNANLHRAREVAKDITEYGEQSPEGYVIDSKEISNVIHAKETQTPHTETTSRIMDFLETFGKDEVRTKIHKGRRIAIFDQDAAEEYGLGVPPQTPCGVILARGRT